MSGTPSPKRGRIALLALRIVLVLVAGRLLLAAVVPFAVERIARAHGFDVAWSRMRIHYLRGAIEFDDLTATIRAADGAPRNEVLLGIESLRGDLAMEDLLRGNMRVQRAHVSGVDVHLERRADGSIPVLVALNAAAEPADVESAAAPAPISFVPPLQVDELRAANVRVHVRDELAWPGQTWNLDVDVRADDIGYTDRRARAEIRASGPNLVDGARVEIAFETRTDDARVDVRFHVGALSATALAPWLAEMSGNPGLASDPSVRHLDVDGSMAAHLRVDGVARDGIAGSLAITDLAVAADGRVLANSSSVSVELASLRSSGAHVTTLEVDGAMIHASIDAHGATCALGFALRTDEPGSGVTIPSTAVPPPAPTPFDVTIDAIRCSRVGASFRDERFEPAVALEASIERALVTGIDTRGGDTRIGVDVEGALPGIAARFGARGSAAIFGAQKAIEIDLSASSLRPDALAPYLAEIGLESTLSNGSLAAKLVGQGRATSTGGVAGDLRLTGIEFVDGEKLFGVRAFEVLGAEIDPASSTVRVRDFVARGTELPLKRGQDRSFAALGLHTITPRSTRRALGESAPRTATSGAPAVRATPPSWPRIEIERLAVVENRISWLDEVLEVPVAVVFDDCGIEIANLELFGEAGLHERSTASVRAWSHAKELVKDFELAGKIATRPGPMNLSVDLTGKASGITAARVQPYLEPTGIQERLQEASIGGRVVARVAQESDGLHADFELLDASIANAEGAITGVKRFAIQNAVVAPDRVAVGSFEVSGARLFVSRDPLGALLTLGLRIPLSAFQRAGSTTAPSESTPADSKAARILANLPDVSVDRIRIDDTELVWRDQSFQPPLETAARLDLEVDRFSTRSAANPARFHVAVGVGDTARAITVEGEARLSPVGATITSACSARGVRAGTLAAYLPEGTECELEAGDVDFRTVFDVAEHELGGLRGRFEVTDLRVAEAGAERPLLALERFETIVDRADPGACVFEVRRVATVGLELDARRDASGRVHALGLVVGGSPRARADASAEAAAAPSASSFDFTLPESARVTLGELDLRLARLAFLDETRDAAPIELAARITAPADQVLVGANARELPPVRVTLEVLPRPFARSARIDLAVSPWADEPHVRAEFAAEGLSGAGLEAVGRDLATWIDGSQLVDGVANGSIEARLRWKRRSPLDLDLRGGFAADVTVGRLEFRDAPNGRVLLALDGGEAEIARVDLATGSVHAKAIELRRPELHAQRTSAGFEILGFVAHPERRPTAAVDAEVASEDTGAAKEPPRPSMPSAGEIRIDELLVRGIDVTLHDEAAEPPTVLPLVDLDVLVRRFTTRAFEEPRVIAFDAWLGAGKASMPRPERASNVFIGVTAAVGAAMRGDDESMRFEERQLFQEASLTGRIQFVPALTGHAQLTLSGLELLGFTGTAKQEGLDVGDGTLDASVRMRFRGDEGVRVDSELVFSDLSLAEPKSGPVETYLTLPIPLDAVLFLLENADGEHRIPIGITLDENGLSGTAIAGAAAGAATSVIGSAVAAAPLRVLSTFTDLFGMSGGEEDPPPTAKLVYATGTKDLDAASIAALRPLVEKMRADADFVVQVQHRLGSDDVARAEVLANPAPEVCREIAEGLRRRRAEIARERGELAPIVRAAWGAGDTASAEAGTIRLRAIDAEAGNVEDALDHVLEHLKPGAERHRAKRTRAAALVVARARIEALRAWFAGQDIPRLEERFEAKPATFEVDPSGAPGSILAVLRERQ